MFIDLYIFNLIHQFAGRFWPLDWLGIFLAQYLPYALVLFALYFWFRRKTGKEKLWFFSFVALSIILSRGIITEVIRFFYHRLRPFEVLNFNPLISPDITITGSFPSGHAAFYFALAFALFYFNKKWGWWFTALALAMGLARVFVGVHYPSDILGGSIIAAASVFTVYLLMGRRLIKENPPSETQAEQEKTAY